MPRHVFAMVREKNDGSGSCDVMPNFSMTHLDLVDGDVGGQVETKMLDRRLWDDDER